MVGGEGSEIGDEEQVEEELDGIRLVALGEDKVFMVGACKRILDPRYGFVQALEVFLLVTVGSVLG